MKMWMAKFNKYLGAKVDSAAMKATATDSLSDCVATSVVLAGVLLLIGGLCVFFIKETYAEKADPETERFDEI